MFASEAGRQLAESAEDEMFKLYRQSGDWPSYERKYLTLLGDREVVGQLDSALFTDGAVLLCSEPTPERCHRRLAAEYLRGLHRNPPSANPCGGTEGRGRGGRGPVDEYLRAGLSENHMFGPYFKI